MKHRTTSSAVGSALVVLLMALAACSQGGRRSEMSHPTTSEPGSTTTTGAPATQPDPDEGGRVQELVWSDCNPGLECADLTVPLDHDDPDGGTIDLALVRRPARGSDRNGSIVINPGGPGASGIEAVSYILMPPSLTQNFDVVGFDPRGVGDSTGLDCHSHLQDIYDADPTMEDGADVEHYREVSQAFVDECEAAHGDLLEHLGTVDVAHDLDLIREALGDEKLTYVGYSYGTSIGQQYARLYPERVRAMVLDGVVDPTMTGLEAAEAQAAGFTRALEAYTSNCDESNCLGRPAASVIQEVMAATEAEPIPSRDADRPATPGVLNLALGQAMYSPILWSQLTRALDDARDGDGSGLVGLADQYLQRQPDGSYGNGFEIYFAVSCLDTRWPRNFDEVLEAGEQVGNRYPLIGEAIVNDYARCAIWPEEPQPIEPIPADIEGLAPIVFISTTGDPATPYESGVRVAESVPGARLITNVGEGHTVFANGKPCIDDTVTAYLLDLTLPEDGLRCE